MNKLIVFVFITFIASNLSGQIRLKREPPREVKPLIVGNVKYTAPTSEMGFIIARDVKTDTILWKKQIYKVNYRKNLETDVQDNFIKKIKIENNLLLIFTEKGKKYYLELE